ncbi:hypothetical protein IE53DRAFT_371436 [Violaceomyces palustris]|uniref:Uncharacterized protein n=1 Tax=Violaceomyces palustris TaxID=1673888 RepID=A0ACD0NNQ5_9BASI|nr:hypothetical protein IE53DRAFT_371436 [Violaceomyces palustris]
MEQPAAPYRSIPSSPQSLSSMSSALFSSPRRKPRRPELTSTKSPRSPAQSAGDLGLRSKFSWTNSSAGDFDSIDFGSSMRRPTSPSPASPSQLSSPCRPQPDRSLQTCFRGWSFDSYRAAEGIHPRNESLRSRSSGKASLDDSFKLSVALSPRSRTPCEDLLPRQRRSSKAPWKPVLESHEAMTHSVFADSDEEEIDPAIFASPSGRLRFFAASTSRFFRQHSDSTGDVVVEKPSRSKPLGPSSRRGSLNEFFGASSGSGAARLINFAHGHGRSPTGPSPSSSSPSSSASPSPSPLSSSPSLSNNANPCPAPLLESRTLESGRSGALNQSSPPSFSSLFRSPGRASKAIEKLEHPSPSPAPKKEVRVVGKVLGMGLGVGDPNGTDVRGKREFKGADLVRKPRDAFSSGNKKGSGPFRGSSSRLLENLESWTTDGHHHQVRQTTVPINPGTPPFSDLIPVVARETQTRIESSPARDEANVEACPSLRYDPGRRPTLYAQNTQLSSKACKLLGIPAPPTPPNRTRSPPHPVRRDSKLVDRLSLLDSHSSSSSSPTPPPKMVGSVRLRGEEFDPDPSCRPIPNQSTLGTGRKEADHNSNKNNNNNNNNNKTSPLSDALLPSRDRLRRPRRAPFPSFLPPQKPPPTAELPPIPPPKDEDEEEKSGRKYQTDYQALDEVLLAAEDVGGHDEEKESEFKGLTLSRQAEGEGCGESEVERSPSTKVRGLTSSKLTRETREGEDHPPPFNAVLTNLRMITVSDDDPPACPSAALVELNVGGRRLMTSSETVCRKGEDGEESHLSVFIRQSMDKALVRTMDREGTEFTSRIGRLGPLGSLLCDSRESDVGDVCDDDELDSSVEDSEADDDRGGLSCPIGDGHLLDQTKSGRLSITQISDCIPGGLIRKRLVLSGAGSDTSDPSSGPLTDAAVSDHLDMVLPRGPTSLTSPATRALEKVLSPLMAEQAAYLTRLKERDRKRGQMQRCPRDVTSEGEEEVHDSGDDDEVGRRNRSSTPDLVPSSSSPHGVHIDDVSFPEDINRSGQRYHKGTSRISNAPAFLFTAISPTSPHFGGIPSISSVVTIRGDEIEGEEKEGNDQDQQQQVQVSYLAIFIDRNPKPYAALLDTLREGGLPFRLQARSIQMVAKGDREPSSNEPTTTTTTTTTRRPPPSTRLSNSTTNPETPSSKQRRKRNLLIKINELKREAEYLGYGSVARLCRKEEDRILLAF